MAEILLIRHGQSTVNNRNLSAEAIAIGNVNAPLTEKGIEQSVKLGQRLSDEFGINPTTYDQPVVASEFLRAQQTAEHAGFKKIHVNPLINESNVSRDVMDGVEIISKHRAEYWAPEETLARAQRFIEAVRSGELGYQIYFAHAMFNTSVLMELEAESPGKYQSLFDQKRGFVPLQTGVLELSL